MPQSHIAPPLSVLGRALAGWVAHAAAPPDTESLTRARSDVLACLTTGVDPRVASTVAALLDTRGEPTTDHALTLYIEWATADAREADLARTAPADDTRVLDACEAIVAGRVRTYTKLAQTPASTPIGILGKVVAWMTCAGDIDDDLVDRLMLRGILRDLNRLSFLPLTRRAREMASAPSDGRALGPMIRAIDDLGGIMVPHEPSPSALATMTSRGMSEAQARHAWREVTHAAGNS